MFFSCILGFVLSILISGDLVVAQTNISSEDNYSIRIPLSGVTLIDESGIIINCTNCYINGDLSLSSGTVDSLPDSNFSSLPFNFSQDWAAAVIEDFTAHFELDFSVLETTYDQYVEADHGLIPLFPDGIGFKAGVPLILDVDFTFNPMIHAAVNTSQPVNFTYGFEFKISPYSAVFMPLAVDGNNSDVQQVGFNKTTITPLTYTSDEPNEDFMFEVSFRPEFKVALDALYFIEPASVDVFADVPKLTVAVQQVYNVTSDCQPAPAGTSSKHTVYSDLTYGSNTGI